VSAYRRHVKVPEEGQCRKALIGKTRGVGALAPREAMNPFLPIRPAPDNQVNVSPLFRGTRIRSPFVWNASILHTTGGKNQQALIRFSNYSLDKQKSPRAMNPGPDMLPTRPEVQPGPADELRIGTPRNPMLVDEQPFG
jgi:hypothetical protein